MEKILLDTDIGGDIDDAVCLAYLLKEPECELLGVTTVCGAPEQRAAVADAICRTVSRAVPIVAGMDIPLQPIPVYPTPDGAAALPNWAHGEFPQGDAPAFLNDVIRATPHEIILIGIGCMTNIAALFRRYPDSPALLKGLVVMNGYFGAAPLPDPTYNWNSWADPLASRIAFAACPPLHRAVPLEITDLLTLEAAQAKRLLSKDCPLTRAVLDFGSAWLESSDRLTLHDPLAAVCVFHPEVCRFERGFVQVETAQTEKMGATSFRLARDGNVEIAREADAERFYEVLSAVLNR